MRHKKTMGRSGGNRSTHTRYDILKTSSLNQINSDLDKVRQALAFCGKVRDPYLRLVRASDRIPLLPDDLKDQAETFLLFELSAATSGIR